MVCLECQVGYHHCCGMYPCCCRNEKIEMSEIYDVAKKERGGQVKAKGDVKDIESTGRKQAAVYYPIEDGMICDWSNSSNCGGGPDPIVGCMGKLAVARHHGPDKNTLNNSMGNVHRICALCHNRWHSSNDKYYSGSRPSGEVPYLPMVPYSSTGHNPRPANRQEQLESELKWRLKTPTK